MATTTKLLQLRPKLKPFPKPKPKFFSSSSSSSSSSNPNPEELTETPPSEPQQTPATPKPFSFSSIANNPQNPSWEASSFDEVRKSLAQFRIRTGSVPSPSQSQSSSPPSFKELFQRNASNIRSDAAANRRTPTTGKFDYNALRANLGNNSQNNENKGKLFDPLSLSRYKDSLKMRPDMGNDVKGSGMVIGGSGNLPASIFGKEMIMRDKEGVDKEGMRMDFVRNYTPAELGEKLKMLRPIKKEEKGWFSISELNDRLMKVRETEEKESKSMVAGVYKDLKESLYKLTQDGEVKAKKTMIQRLDVLGQLGGTPSFMLHPPKEHLVEKFFHPDHMSSGEKMKLELQKVRDEFKMSESDCGSARVQVAQLTTKIKHLSTVLHKKDKHSRKGLQQMVQNRKKLLKYLRRTDWDSYCLVLSKLGLRDNPDYKF